MGFEFQVSEIFEDLCPRMFDPIYLKLFQGQESELLSCNGKISNDTCSEHSRLTDRGVMDANSVMKDSLSFCNGVCNRRNCLDEAECNGYSYGIFCSSHGNTNRTTYVSPHLVCDGLPGCANDKANCCVKQRILPLPNVEDPPFTHTQNLVSIIGPIQYLTSLDVPR